MEIIMNGVSYVFEKAGDGVAWLVGKAGEGAAWGFNKVLEVVGTGALALIKELAGCSTIFAIAGVVGMFIVMTGHKDLGTKITSGSIITFVACKVVDGLC